MWHFADDIRKVLWFAVLPGVVSVFAAVARAGAADGLRKPRRLPLTRAKAWFLGPAFWRVARSAAGSGWRASARRSWCCARPERGVPATWIPSVLVVMSVVYALSAYPAGKLSDAMPRRRLLAWGMAVLLLADVLLAKANGYALLFAGIALGGCTWV